MSNGEVFENLKAELRRGTLVVAVLAQLRKEQYGYQLRVSLAGCGLEVEENTLYPLVRRLESQGLLVSEWREEDKRQKRFYKLSAAGSEMLEKLRAELWHINEALGRML
jgi:PadR family transcriptional regulator, regulatory protein PadR